MNKSKELTRAKSDSLDGDLWTGVQGNGFLKELNKNICERFTKISGLTAIVVPIDIPGYSKNILPAQYPLHPACYDYAYTHYCRDSWKDHLEQIRQTRKPHWHRCKRDKLCVVAPLFWNHRCLVALKVVCPGSVEQKIFDEHVELLSVLIENYILNKKNRLNSRFIKQQKSNKYFSGDGELTVTTVKLKANHPQISRAIEYIERHLNNPKMTVAKVANELNVNSTYLSHLFSDHTGMRMSHFITLQRLELAKKKLADTDWQIKRVAMESGHANADWFSQVFRTHTGMTPRQYRNLTRKKKTN